MIERARRTAHFRLVIVDGKAYVDKYKQSIQTRDAFTLWGILQLMRWYPGRLPDLELMFDCDDRPVVRSKDFQGPNSTGPPPLFRYCADGQSLDIVFPDWSFWGWTGIVNLNKGINNQIYKINAPTEAIGEAASNFIQEDMKMDYIYDYMFHLLNEYAKLLKYKPTIPAEAVELLRLYPGRVPDLELMFGCGDIPVVVKHDYQGPNATSPPPVFQYCGHADKLGIIFPDWAFWGWAEINIKPWESMLQGLIKGNKKKKWKDRVPYAYWKGNPDVTSNRGNLMSCDVSDKHDWNARLYRQASSLIRTSFLNWVEETKHGFKHSKLEDQCTHRYKIYIEGRGWSVSGKYILSCDSMTLLIKPDYYDFFMRSLVPMQHYWPISATNKCRDIKFAVEWGNSHPYKAQAIGKAGSRFIQENLKMEYVYAYMFHLLREYAKLLKFKPEIPAGGVELCSESMACPEGGLRRKFMVESMVDSPSDTLPCTMPPPFDPPALEALFDRNENITRQVVMWQNEYWENLNKNQSSPHHH
ncbi:hypothetical protein GH714_038830 [Hevea brasiliensis]|uniref:Glycosyl transferase CAP10 domain-containing protein n=1 Tax=Hevea brasiliensis TaxID=3981 RepID=A0A6A6MT13_HEVBR|nr:hypothetical protein GH714_038830 [Hevea brasiliensis]